jgi:hypothetical protein
MAQLFNPGWQGNRGKWETIEERIVVDTAEFRIRSERARSMRGPFTKESTKAPELKTVDRLMKANLNIDRRD